jgi:hypothetical protein
VSSFKLLEANENRFEEKNGGVMLIAGNDVMGGQRQTFGVSSHGKFGRSGSQDCRNLTSSPVMDMFLSIII